MLTVFLSSDLRNSLDTLRLETDKQSNYHQTLSQQIRNDIEAQTNQFAARQAHFKKTCQAAIEKEYKAKQTHEGYVNRSREKYESDCLRINSYTAQSSLVQGKDLDKINFKLERAQQTVQANERDFQNFSRAYQDTVAKWDQDWKGFCDQCQDLEEERIEFMKDNMWAYANAVSTVCVSDDEVCLASIWFSFLPADFCTLVVRTSPCSSRANGAGSRNGELRARLRDWQSNSRPSSVRQLHLSRCLRLEQSYIHSSCSIRPSDPATSRPRDATSAPSRRRRAAYDHDWSGF